MKVEVAVQGSPFLISLMPVSVDVKATLKSSSVVTDTPEMLAEAKIEVGPAERMWVFPSAEIPPWAEVN